MLGRFDLSMNVFLADSFQSSLDKLSGEEQKAANGSRGSPDGEKLCIIDKE